MPVSSFKILFNDHLDLRFHVDILNNEVTNPIFNSIIQAYDIEIVANANICEEILKIFMNEIFFDRVIPVFSHFTPAIEFYQNETKKTYIDYTVEGGLLDKIGDDIIVAAFPISYDKLNIRKYSVFPT